MRRDMSTHPPWLRFQAYVVGLPKTGSTSIATVFARYRSAHEWDLMPLVGLGVQYRTGEIGAEELWDRAGRRLDPPGLEMDSATSHHLYADVLAERFPQARFVHTVRDVRGWTTSLLDMVLRKRLARRMIDVPYSEWERSYLAYLTDGAYLLDPGSADDDRAAVVPLMRYWAAHVRDMAARLPADRTLVLRTRDIAHRTDALAALVAVPVESLRVDLSHANRAPLTLDRMGAFDSPAIRAAYDEHCADLMAALFPEEHAAWLGSAGRTTPADWDGYVADLTEWVAAAVAEHGAAASR